MSSICNSLFEALFPGSSYPTRFSALTILGSIAEVFPVPEGKFSIMFRKESVFILKHFPKHMLFQHFVLLEFEFCCLFRLLRKVLFSLYNSYVYIIKFVNKGHEGEKLSVVICQLKTTVFMEL